MLNSTSCVPEPGKADQGGGRPLRAGSGLYRQYCVGCHGADGTLGLNGARDLTQSALTLEERITQIANGKNMMTPFRDVLSAEEIQAVAEYTMGFKK